MSAIAAAAAAMENDGPNEQPVARGGPESTNVPDGQSNNKRRLVPSGGSNQAIQLMDGVRNKLSLLNYEADFCEANDTIPFSSIYFAIPASNQSVQFQHMVSLIAWLFQSSGRHFIIDQFDDPNSSVNKILGELTDMGFQADFGPMKLRQGHGESVCKVLDFLCNRSLEFCNFQFETPEYPTAGFAEEAVADEDAEIDDEDVEAGAESDEEEFFYSDLVHTDKRRSEESKLADEEDTSQREIMKATVDPVAWKTEVERVAPRLKIKQVYSGKEWRSHLEQTKNHEIIMQKLMPDTKTSLQKIGAEVSSMLERVQNRERYINSTFDELTEQYKAIKVDLDDVSAAFKNKSEHISELTNQLANVSDQLEELQGQMEDRGSSMTDTSPLVKIKAALNKLRQEIKSMDIRTGVLTHSLMQAKLQRANQLANKRRVNRSFGDDSDSDLTDQSESDNELPARNQ